MGCSCTRFHCSRLRLPTPCGFWWILPFAFALLLAPILVLAIRLGSRTAWAFRPLFVLVLCLFLGLPRLLRDFLPVCIPRASICPVGRCTCMSTWSIGGVVALLPRLAALWAEGCTGAVHKAAFHTSPGVFPKVRHCEELVEVNYVPGVVLC